jgi:hypothetical protein
MTARENLHATNISKEISSRETKMYFSQDYANLQCGKKMILAQKMFPQNCKVDTNYL